MDLGTHVVAARHGLIDGGQGTASEQILRAQALFYPFLRSRCTLGGDDWSIPALGSVFETLDDFDEAVAEAIAKERPT